MVRNSRHSTVKVAWTAWVTSVCQGASPELSPFPPYRACVIPAFLGSSIISKCVCLGRTVTFACFPPLVKRLGQDRPLLLEQHLTERWCSCLLISPFNKLDISEAPVHFVLTAGVLTSNGTLGRTGLIWRRFQQQQISGAQIWSHLCGEIIHSFRKRD